jgi:hypothetical protein
MLIKHVRLLLFSGSCYDVQRKEFVQKYLNVTSENQYLTALDRF